MANDLSEESPREALAGKMRWIAALGTEAVLDVLDENRRLGIPSAFEFRGRLVFEMPDGTLTTENPFRDDRAASE